ncbi:hypothetical protein CMI37_37170 [Candidatus Pacearchaeota archaeon]|nr:hypothetical protein [Candidatus Pacearchaeota archaeon]|tara:strand:- start:97 stop:459 length:363 start_codon:yes stop_codon:yes gene_type:complete
MESKTITLFKDKKAQVAKKINSIILIILSVVILFQIFTALVPEAQSAGEQLGDAERCSVGGGFYNTSQTACLTNSSPEGTNQIYSPIPVSSLFGNSGVVILLLLVSLFLIVIKMVMPTRK